MKKAILIILFIFAQLTILTTPSLASTPDANKVDIVWHIKLRIQGQIVSANAEGTLDGDSLVSFVYFYDKTQGIDLCYNGKKNLDGTYTGELRPRDVERDDETHPYIYGHFNKDMMLIPGEEYSFKAINYHRLLPEPTIITGKIVDGKFTNISEASVDGGTIKISRKNSNTLSVYVSVKFVYLDGKPFVRSRSFTVPNNIYAANYIQKVATELRDQASDAAYKAANPSPQIRKHRNPIKEKCYQCGGTGFLRVEQMNCPRCNGRGWYYEWWY